MVFSFGFPCHSFIRFGFRKRQQGTRKPPTVYERRRGMAPVAEVLRYLVTGKRILTYRASLAAASGQGTGGIGDPRRGVQHRPRQLQGRLDRRPRTAGPPGRSRGRRFSRHHRRGLADAAAVARLCRGAIAKPGRGAGDQPALSVRPDRPARYDRWAPLRPPPLRRTGARPLLRRRDPAGCGSCRDDELLDHARQKGSTVYHATRT
jgi:hypothetical protein